MSARREKRRGRDGEENWYWIVDFVFRHADGRRERIRRYSPVNNRRGAEEYERRLRDSYLFGSRDEASEVREPETFEQFSRDFEEIYVKANNKYSEAVSKRSILASHLIPVFGKLKLSAIDEEQVARYKASRLEMGLATKTINNHLTTLKTMLTIAVEWKRLERAPIIKRLPSPKAKFDFLSFAEADALLLAAESEPGWASMIVVALNTGMRMGELLALQWGDCDFDKRQVTVTRRNWRGDIDSPKSGKGRVIPLNARAFVALTGRRPRKFKANDLVWTRPQDGRPRAGGSAVGGSQTSLTKDHLAAALKRIARRAGLWTPTRRIGFHCMRHTFASHLVMRGVSLKAVQELLGHGSIEMTMRYAHLSPEVRISAVNALVDGDAGALHGTLKAHQLEAANGGVNDDAEK